MVHRVVEAEDSLGDHCGGADGHLHVYVLVLVCVGSFHGFEVLVLDVDWEGRDLELSSVGVLHLILLCFNGVLLVLGG